MRGNIPEERGGLSIGPGGVERVEEEAEAEQDDASSGKGYSYFVESVANGVQTNWVEGECNVSWSRFASLGISAWGRRRR
jgi:hypothetical protein